MLFLIYFHALQFVVCYLLPLYKNNQLTILIFAPLPVWLSFLSEKRKTSERKDQCFQIFPQEGALRPTSCSSTSTSTTPGQRRRQAVSSPRERCSWCGWDQVRWPWWSEWRHGESAWRSENPQRKNENRSLPDLRSRWNAACEKAYWSIHKKNN